MKRSKSGKAWMREHVTDPYVKRAKTDGMRSRAAYKLEQLTDRDRLLAPGMTVVDLGAAPGGWSQVAARRTAPGGRVIALDILPMTEMGGVTFIQGDFREDEVLAALEEALAGAPVDLVVSDMSPNISGIASADQARAVLLAELARDFALKHLKPRGNFLVKMFQGEGFEQFVTGLRRDFSQVVIRKPDASRSRSSEVYVLGKGLKRPKAAV